MSHPHAIIEAMVGVAAVMEVRDQVAALAAGFDPALLSVADAERVVEAMARVENMAATVRALAARRVAETEHWRRRGDRSPAHNLARLSGSSVGNAQKALDTAGALGELPRLAEAARRGQVSPAQAAAIADAATADPAAERRLLEQARRSSLGELLDHCARTKAAAQRDAEARHRAVHAARHLRQRRCADGGAELVYRSTAEEVAEVLAVARGYGEVEFARARQEGRREQEEAYLADGLLAMARVAADPGAAVAEEGHDDPAPGTGGPAPVGPERAKAEQVNRLLAELGQPVLASTGDELSPGGEGPAGGGGKAPPARGSPANRRQRRQARPVPAKIIVRIDHSALVRGWAVGEEVCDIPGVGPVSPSAVRAMIDSGDAFLVAVVTKGVDVVSVAHLGRGPSAHQRSALEWLYDTCVVEGCNNSRRLESDHRRPWADDKVTLLSNLDRPCGFHHDLKTYKGWALVEGVGKRPMVSPDDPRHPANVRASTG